MRVREREGEREGERERERETERKRGVIVFSCQKFNTYILGRSFTMESDYKPLDTIHMKDLANVPSWL